MGIGAVPSKAVPKALDRITGFFVQERKDKESFQEFVTRIGKKKLRDQVTDLLKLPAYEKAPEYYSDWGDPREFSIGDMGTGECAGEVVSFGEFELASAEQLVFEAQIKLDDQELLEANQLAYQAMLEAAKGLIKMEKFIAPQQPDSIVSEFKTLFHETQIFHDKYAGSKFADYLFSRHERNGEKNTVNGVKRLVGESQLFIEAAYACRERIEQKKLQSQQS